MATEPSKMKMPSKARTANNRAANARGRTTPLSAECKRLLAQVQRQCPGLLPPDPLPAGTVGPAITLKSGELQPLVSAAADPLQRGTVVWTQGDNELLVHTAKVSIQITRGFALVNIPVQCEETGTVRIDVNFAVGDDQAPAGMIAATEQRPRGPALITVPWGDALIAFAWQILLNVTAEIADGVGTDNDGVGLIPAAISADNGSLRVLTQARHTFDRAVR